MEGFKKLCEVHRAVAEPKSDDGTTLFSKLDKARFVENMVEEEELTGY
jgi:hypothetical protein